MKRKVIALATILSAAFAGSSMAYDGTITFTGKVVAQTCSVNTNDKNLAVTLPTVSTTTLNENAATARSYSIYYSFNWLRYWYGWCTKCQNIF